MTTHEARLKALREELATRRLDGFLVPRSDEHLGEEAPASAERLAWLTGFSGSEGVAMVLPDRAAVASDGRYVLQLAQQTDAALWQRLHQVETPPATWLAAHAKAGAAIGFDPRLISEEALGKYEAAGLRMVAVADNPLDAVWSDRPAPPTGAVRPHPVAFAGETAAAKRTRMGAVLAEAGEDAVVLTDPGSVAWLLNVRGDDVASTPLVLAFALLRADGRVDLFVEPARVPAETREWLGNEVAIAPPGDLPAALARLAGCRVRVDRAGANAWIPMALRDAGAQPVAGADPCLLGRACKNAVEQEGARRAHLRDGVAMCRFLHWFEGAVPGEAGGQQTEMSAAARLLAFRAEGELFRGESFPAISGAGPNGAIMHYRASPQTDRTIGANEVYLIDSGGQYADGTTDVTRTLWTGPDAPPAEVRARYTLVLRGHVALSMQRFPAGVTGARLDSLARAPLWQAGLDYDHGTGHGVGSYLGVHEGPARISFRGGEVALRPGMILSNEPGFYLPGEYGMRIETMVLVAQAPPVLGREILCFETLTVVPYARRLIEVSLLTHDERDWIDAYHARVLAAVGPLVSSPARNWLMRACAPLETGDA